MPISIAWIMVNFMPDCSELGTLFIHEFIHVTRYIRGTFLEDLESKGEEKKKKKNVKKVVTQKCWPRYLFAKLLKLDEARRK